MTNGSLLSADHLRTLLYRLANAPFGAWDVAAIQAVSAGEAWTLDRAPGSPKDVAASTPSPLLGAQWHADLLRDGGFQTLEVTIGRGVNAGQVPQIVSVVSAHLGFAPQMRGGFGAGAAYHCWRPPQSHPLYGLTHFIVFDAGHVTLRLSPSDAYEHRWSQSLEHGVPNSTPQFPVWTAFDPRGRVDGMAFPGGSYATDWQGLTYSLMGLLHALSRALPTLGDGVTVVLYDGAGDTLLQFWIDSDGDLFVVANVAHPNLPGPRQIADLGYTSTMPGDQPDPVYMVHPADQRDCLTAAGVIIETLRAMRASVLAADEFGRGFTEPTTAYEAFYQSDQYDGAPIRLWGTGFRPVR